MDRFIRDFWYLRKMAKRTRLTSNDVAVLVYLGECSDKTRPACIIAALSIPGKLVSDSLSRLVARGLVYREVYSKDRRIKFAALTGSGSGLYAAWKRDIESSAALDGAA